MSEFNAALLPPPSQPFSRDMSYYPPFEEEFKKQLADEKSHQSQQQVNESQILQVCGIRCWMDEGYLKSCFYGYGLQNAYVFTINETQQERHFGFLVFRTRQEAEQALQLFNGTPMPQTKKQPFMLKWSSSRRLFIGNPQVSYDMLEELFNVNGAMDSVYVNQSGETVVQFTNEHKKLQALKMADWTLYPNLNICVRLVSHSENRREYLPIPCPKASEQYARDVPETPADTTIFVYGLDTRCRDYHLRNSFGRYGHLVAVKMRGTNKGFVRFAKAKHAEKAICMMQGTKIKGQTVILHRAPIAHLERDRCADHGTSQGSYASLV